MEKNKIENEIGNLIDIVVDEDEYGEHGTVNVNINGDDVEIHPRYRSEPEDAIWHRDLSDIFLSGIRAGIRASIVYFNNMEIERDGKDI